MPRYNQQMDMMIRGRSRSNLPALAVAIVLEAILEGLIDFRDGEAPDGTAVDRERAEEREREVRRLPRRRVGQAGQVESHCGWESEYFPQTRFV
jgi:hypothetical protein